MTGNSDNSAEMMYNFSVLRDLRKRAEMTIADLSERTGISPAVISKLELSPSCTSPTSIDLEQDVWIFIESMRVLS